MRRSFVLLCVSTFGVLATRGSRDLGHPIPSQDIEYALECPKCYQERRGRDGRYRCVRVENCCLPRENKMNCVVNPCLFFQRSCKEAVYCIPVACGLDYCTNELYDVNFDLIDYNYCNKTSTKAKKRVLLNKTKRVILVSRAQPSLIRRIQVFDPTRLQLKPGTCPLRREIIKVCVNECTYDSNCPGRQKCCWNGCAGRCSDVILNPLNYLNLPITVNRRP